MGTGYCRIRGTEVRLYKRTPKAKRLVSVFPWVCVGTEARAVVVKRLWEREGVVPDWFHKAALGLSIKPKAPLTLMADA